MTRLLQCILTICFGLLSTIAYAEIADTSSTFSSLRFDTIYGWDTPQKWKSFRAEQQADLELYHTYMQQKQSHTTNCLKSLLAPGWGHFSAQRYVKGEILLGIQIILVGSAIYHFDKSEDFYTKYKNANEITTINQYYSDANSAYQTAQLFAGLWALSWIYTLFDSIQVTENYNRNLWYKMKATKSTTRLSIQPGKISFEF